MSFFDSVLAAGNTVLGGPKTIHSETTVDEKPSTNWGLIIGGIVLALGALGLGIWWFKKKNKKTDNGNAG